MIRQTGSQSRSTLDPMETMPSDRKAETQALVEVTEIVDAAEDIHAVLQGGAVASQVTGPTEQASQTLAEGGIEPFDVGSIYYAASLCCLEQLLDHRFGSLDDEALDVPGARGFGFHDLDNGDIGPFDQRHPSRLACQAGDASAKGIPKDVGVEV